MSEKLTIGRVAFGPPGKEKGSIPIDWVDPAELIAKGHGFSGIVSIGMDRLKALEAVAEAARKFLEYVRRWPQPDDEWRNRRRALDDAFKALDALEKDDE